MKPINSILGCITYNLFYPFQKSKMNVLSLYFHAPLPDSFEKVILWCKKKGYEFVHIDEITKYAKGENTEHNKMVHFSFDDGWLSNKALIPIIEKYNVPITIFVPVEPLESGNFWWNYVYAKYKSHEKVEEFKTYDEARFNIEVAKIKEEIKLDREAVTFDELKEMSKHPLINIQSHTYNHPILTNVNDNQLDFELSESKKFLSTLLNKDIGTFSYPNGSFGKREENAVREYYKCGYTTEEVFVQPGGNVYRIPRTCLVDNYWSNLSRIVGAWKLIKKIIS